MIHLVPHPRFKSRHELRRHPSLQCMGPEGAKDNPQATKKTAEKEEESPHLNPKEYLLAIEANTCHHQRIEL